MTVASKIQMTPEVKAISINLYKFMFYSIFLQIAKSIWWEVIILVNSKKRAIFYIFVIFRLNPLTKCLTF